MGNRQRLVLYLIVTVLALPVCADPGKRAYKQGVRAERQADYDAAFAAYKQAYLAAPNNANYFTAFTRLRFHTSSQHVHTGQALRSNGALSEALEEFRHAAEIDASNFVAQQELRRTVDMIQRLERQKSAPKGEAAQLKTVEEIGESVELTPLSNAPISLRLTANSDVAYKTICKLAGVNVVLDPDYKPQKITVDLVDVTLREALDMVRLQSKTFWRPVAAKTILIATDSPAKRKEFEQNVMKTFYLRNISTPNELQEAANIVRQILDVSRVQLIQAQDALVLRGTKDQMVLAERLLSDFDQPKSEVVIDITVMEVTRDRLRNLGTNVPTSASIDISRTGSGGIRTSGSGSGGSTSSGGGATYNLGNFSVSIPGSSFTALASSSDSKILQRPEIRALNDEKATLRIGDRVPIATGSFSPGIGGGGVSPLVSTQFQYLDVGVNVDITPHIHDEHEVTLKMVLEISSVTGSSSIGGITQPIIGQRRIEHSARLTDGEVNLLGGILNDSETQSLSGLPWISRIPLLKYMFAQDNRDHRENEIVFAITPHIVRSHEVTEESQRLIDVGTGNAIELRHKTPTPAAPAPVQPAAPAKPQPLAPQAESRQTPLGTK